MVRNERKFSILGISLLSVLLLGISGATLQDAFGHGDVDQSVTGTFTQGTTIDANSPITGQLFTPTDTQLDSVTIALNDFASTATSDTMTITIWTGPKATGTNLGQVSKLVTQSSPRDVGFSPGQYRLEHFDFSSSVNLSLCLPTCFIQVTTTNLSENVFTLLSNSANPYAGGHFVSFNVDRLTQDAGFQTFSLPETPVITTNSNPTGGDVVPGTSVTDDVTVVGSNGPTPTGTVEFFLCNPVEVINNGADCNIMGTSVGISALDGAGSATSPSTSATTQIGTYCWRAVYSGDANYSAASHFNSTTECFTTTTILDPTITTLSNPTGSGIFPGTSVTDDVTVSGTGPTPTGTVEFFLCNPVEVINNGADCNIMGTSVGMSTLDGAGSATSPSTSATVNEGTYCWRAVYSGDSNYSAASHFNSTTECFTIMKQDVTISTQSNPTGDTFLGTSATDDVTVSGSGPTPTGTVTFFLCNPSQLVSGECLVGTQVGLPPDLVSGSATSDPTSDTSLVGDYCWRAVYSGDDNYNAATHTNLTTECFTTVEPPTISVMISGTLGDNGWYTDNVSVDWTVTGETFPPIGCLDTTVSADTAGTNFDCSATNAGGTTVAPTETVKRDANAPNLTLIQTPSTPDGSNNWFVTAVLRDYSCTDATSDVATAPVDETLTEGENQSSVAANCIDNAGNESIIAVVADFDVDTTDPTLTLVQTPSTPDGSNNWFVTAVLRDYSCSDATSDVATAPVDETLNEGENQSSVAANCIDNAGNESIIAVVADFDVDTTDPTLTLVQTPAAPDGLTDDLSNNWFVTAVLRDYSCSDATSGVATPPVDETLTEGVNQSSVAANCIDVAGNESIIAVVADFDVDTTDPVQGTLPTTILDNFTGLPEECSGLTCQADSVDGSVITFTAPTTSDVTSTIDPNTTGCVQPSGDLFAVSPSTEVACAIFDKAGNGFSNSFFVTINPFIEFDSSSYQIDSDSTLRISDPSANLDSLVEDTIVANVTSPTSLAITTERFLTPTLTETGVDTGIFEVSDVKLSSIDTVNANNLLLVSVEDIVDSTYPVANPTSFTAAEGTGTEVTGATASGILAKLSDLDPVRFSSDVFRDGESGNLAHIKLGANCAALSSTVVDTVSIKVFTLPAPDVNEIEFDLIENSPSSCIFEAPNLIKFTESGDSIDDPTATGFPQMKIKRFTNLRAEITEGPTTGQANAVLIWAPSTFVPSTGFTLPVTALNCGANNDNDNDGLCNSWETTAGLVIPFGDGTYFYPCERLVDDPIRGDSDPLNTDPRNPVTCPDPDRKDIYLELDFMTGHKPFRESMLQLVQAYQDGSNINPDASTGINLHIQVDDHYGFHQQVLQIDECGADPSCFTSYRDLKTQFFGTAADRTDDADGTALDKLAAKRQAFRYGSSIHQQEANPFSSGYAEIKGNDLILSLGLFTAGIGSVDQQTGTLMHETGHIIGLNHGGAFTNTQGCKPNYLSVMNYAFQFSNLVSDRPLDFSREKLNDIYEGNLDETVGIVAGAESVGLTTVYGNVNLPAPKNVLKTLTLVSGNNPVDWSQNGGPLQPVTGANINLFGFGGCNNEAAFGGSIDNLLGYDDWDGINLLMRSSVFFADGVKALNPNDPTNLDDDQSAVEFPATLVGVGPLPTALLGSNIGTEGVYEGNEGDVMTLDSTGSSDVAPGFIVDLVEDIPQTQWDIDGDGKIHGGSDSAGSIVQVYLDDDESNASAGTGEFPIGVSVWDDDDNTDSATGIIRILNVAPTVEAGIDHVIDEGDSISLDPATFTDPGVLDVNNIASIDWGDLSAIVNCDNTTCLTETAGQAPDLEAETPTPRVDTTGTVSGAHTYAVSGTYTVTVTVTDKDGGVGIDMFTVEVKSPFQNIEDIITELEKINKPKADDAIAKLETAIAELAAEDEIAALGAVEGAIGDIDAGIDNREIKKKLGTDIMDALAGISRGYAVDAIDLAIASNGDQNSINEAQNNLALGDDYRDDKQYKDAAAQYKIALSDAISALS